MPDNPRPPAAPSPGPHPRAGRRRVAGAARRPPDPEAGGGSVAVARAEPAIEGAKWTFPALELAAFDEWRAFDGDRTAAMADGAPSSPIEGAPSRMGRLGRRANGPHSASRAIPDGRKALIARPAAGAGRNRPISGKYLRLLRLLPVRRDSRFSGYQRGSPRRGQNPEAPELPEAPLPHAQKSIGRRPENPNLFCARGDTGSGASGAQGRHAGNRRRR